MNRETIKKKLDELYADNKSKGFLSHLIKAYLPVSKIVKVNDKPKEGRLVCVLTDQKLITVDEIPSSVQSEEFKLSLNNNLKVSIEGNIQPMAMIKVINGKVLGLTGENTNTFISYEAVQALNEWVANKLTSGDAHIKWLIGRIKAESNPKVKFQKKSQSEGNGYRKPTTTFGDLGILQELKSKLIKEEVTNK